MTSDNHPAESSDAETRVVRHDMLSLLNQVLGYAELVEEEVLESNVTHLAEDLQRIRKVAYQMVGLVQERFRNASHPETDLIRQSSGDSPESMLASLKVESLASASNKLSGRVLVVDDDVDNRQMLVRQLKRIGLSSATAETGDEALRMLEEESFDLVLLDVLMSGSSGIEILHRIKQSELLKHIPVLMLSALGELDTACECIDAGAEDYLTKPINTILWRSRIGACLEKKRLRDIEQSYLREVERTQARLSKELMEAAEYLRTVLPPPVKKPFAVQWKHESCSELGGDAFGYHWIDDDHFAFYILDVSGHGVRAALLAAAALHVIRSGEVVGIDSLDPGQVLTRLNKMFPMDRQGHQFFTFWYGVYDRRSRELRYSGAGHPPGIVMSIDNEGLSELLELESDGTIIGIVADSSYQTSSCAVPPNASIYLLTDGCFEVVQDYKQVIHLQDLYDFLQNTQRHQDVIEDWYQLLREKHPLGSLDDDFTMLSVHIP